MGTGARVIATLLLVAPALAGCEHKETELSAAGEHDRPASSALAPASGSAKGQERPSALDEAAQRAHLTFRRNGQLVRSLSLAEMMAANKPETWTAFDPYYKKAKTFRTLRLAAVVRQGFAPAGGGAAEKPLEREEFVFRASDGYTVPLRGDKVFEEGGYIAIEDVEVPGWELIGPQKANPGPFYVVWREPDQQNLETHPRPWQLASIEIAPFEAIFPHTVPAGLPADAPAMRGFAIFRDQCLQCHAVNREGGRIGPELNVPQSIVEYRPEPQIRAYIKDPLTFRYGNMPPHPSMTDADLDALIAYFHAMKERKHDPDKAAAKGAPPPDGGVSAASAASAASVN